MNIFYFILLTVLISSVGFSSDIKSNEDDHNKRKFIHIITSKFLKKNLSNEQEQNLDKQRRQNLKNAERLLGLKKESISKAK